jgi:hypothetical protein
MHVAVPKSSHLPLDCSRKSTELGLRNSAAKRMIWLVLEQGLSVENLVSIEIF